LNKRRLQDEAKQLLQAGKHPTVNLRGYATSQLRTKLMAYQRGQAHRERTP
jgi:hypothetical protein